MLKKCLVCGEEYRARMKKQRFCPVCSGTSAANRYCYNSRLYDKTCAVCGTEFRGRKKRNLCDDCYKKNRQSTMVHKYDNMERPVRCGKCTQIYRTETVKRTSRTLSSRIHGLCSRCAKGARKRAGIHRIFTNITRPILCPCCGKETGTETVKKVYQTKPSRIGKLCVNCKRKKPHERYGGGGRPGGFIPEVRRRHKQPRLG